MTQYNIDIYSGFNLIKRQLRELFSCKSCLYSEQGQLFPPTTAKTRHRLVIKN